MFQSKLKEYLNGGQKLKGNLVKQHLTGEYST